MVLLIQKINKLYSKLENINHQHKQHDDPLPLLRAAALQAFRSKVSSLITNLLLTTPNPDDTKLFLSLPWLRSCFQLLPMINDAFAKLVVDIDYPMNKWQDRSVHLYLTHTLNLLDLLNSITSSIASLGQSRLSLSHALSQVVNGSPSSSAALNRLKMTTTTTATQLDNSSRKVEVHEEKGDYEVKNGSLCEREAIIHEALMEMKSVGFWVSSIVLACLSGDSKAYLEEQSTRPVLIASLTGIESVMWGFVKEKGIVAKEVKDLNDSAARIATEISSNRGGGVLEVAGEMQRKLEVFEKLLDGLRVDVDRLFSEILNGRNELLRCFLHGNH